jgi:hypothetical protein
VRTPVVLVLVLTATIIKRQQMTLGACLPRRRRVAPPIFGRQVPSGCGKGLHRSRRG